MREKISIASFFILFLAIFPCSWPQADKASRILAKKEELEQKISAIKEREQEINNIVKSIVVKYRQGVLKREEAAKKIRPYLSESIALARKTLGIVLDNMDILYDDLVTKDPNFKNLKKDEAKAKIATIYESLARSHLGEKALNDILDKANF